MNDDDLPVLTQVLRVRSGPLSQPLPPATDTPIPDQLVIGNEPRPTVEPDAPAPAVVVEVLPAEAVNEAEPGRSSVVAPDAVAAMDDPATLARRVREAVLAGLVARIDTELDARIAQAIHIEVETAVAQLQDKLRAHLTESLRDVVARAVDEEIGRLTRPSDPRNA